MPQQARQRDHAEYPDLLADEQTEHDAQWHRLRQTGETDAVQGQAGVRERKYRQHGESDPWMQRVFQMTRRRVVVISPQGNESGHGHACQCGMDPGLQDAQPDEQGHQHVWRQAHDAHAVQNGQTDDAQPGQPQKPFVYFQCRWNIGHDQSEHGRRDQQGTTRRFKLQKFPH
jgi:hypothetical protein